MSVTYVNNANTTETAELQTPTMMIKNTSNNLAYQNCYYITNYQSKTITFHGTYYISRNRSTGRICCHASCYTKEQVQCHINIFGDIPSFVLDLINGGTYSPGASTYPEWYDRLMDYEAPMFNAVGADIICILQKQELLSWIAENMFTVNLQPITTIPYSDGSYTKIDTKLDKIMKKYSTFK